MTRRIEKIEMKMNTLESSMSRMSETLIRIESKLDAVDLQFNAVNSKIETATKLNDANIRSSAAETKLAIILAIPAIIGIGTAIFKILQFYSR